MFLADIEKEWGEVYRKGRGKVEDWSWMVTFYDCWQAGVHVMDRHWYKTEADAKFAARLFETHKFLLGQHKEILFEKVFEDYNLY